ncbi:procollagen galactosyltransferase 2-like, partial [Saccoglossus kowalevskii]|uniref:Procollagen galactosyltransferase 2-like n=1 Tax=Saccoglossus kowalevskii TaxID=10224 RepID=A0ABM0M8Z3_SACKO
MAASGWNGRTVSVILSILVLSGVQITLSQNNNTDNVVENVHAESEFQNPTIFLPILARNKAHTLPVFLAYIDRLDYPKSRMRIWIQSDHNIDNTTSILKEWVSNVKHTYRSIDESYADEPDKYSTEVGPLDWPEERFSHMIKLRQEALDEARRQWADFIFFVDCDNFIEEPQTLNLLIAEKKTIIAPMMESDSAYANFWCGVDDQGYYIRTPEYLPTLRRERKGCFPVPMVHSTFLIDLRRSSSLKLQFNPLNSYRGDYDDILIFAYSAKIAEIQMYVLNTWYFGMLLSPLQNDDTLHTSIEQMVHCALESMIDRPPLLTSEHVTVPVRHTERLGFDEIYMINLLRRPDRRERMVAAFDLLGIDATLVDAVDGQELTDEKVLELGIKMLPGFADPYHGRELTKGEIGCFLSHYNIWQEVVSKNYSKVMVLEDDVRFKFKFLERLNAMMAELKELHINWDIVAILEETKEAQKFRKRQSGNDPFKLETGGLVDMKQIKDRNRDRSEEDTDRDVVDMGSTFAAETNRRDEDADMMKYIEEQMAKRKGKAMTKEEERRLKSAEDLLYELPARLQVESSSQKTEEMMSHQMLSGIPEVDLGI